MTVLTDLVTAATNLFDTCTGMLATALGYKDSAAASAEAAETAAAGVVDAVTEAEAATIAANAAAAAALAAITAPNPRGAWVTATAYALRDTFVQGGIAYITTIAHTSGAFATDLAAGKMAVFQGVVGTDLANSSDPAKGAGLVGWNGTTVAAALAAGGSLGPNLLDHTDVAKGSALVGHQPTGGTVAQALSTALATAPDLASASDPAKGAALVGYVGRNMADQTRMTADQIVAQRAIRKFQNKVRVLLSGATTRIGIYAGGDSVAGYLPSELYPVLLGSIGLAGIALGAFGTTSQQFNSTISGDVTGPNGTTIPYDYTYWPTGTHQDIGVGGTTRSLIGGGSFTGTRFTWYYVKRPGGGTVRVELLNTAETVVQQTIDIDTNAASVSLGIQTFTEVAAFTGRIRVTGLTGRCIGVGFACINTLISGAVLIGLNRGGLGLNDWASAPAALWKAAIADLSPDLGLYSARESVAWVQTYFDANYISEFRAAAPNMEWIIAGPWPYGAGPAADNDFGKNPPTAPSWLEGEANRVVAEKYGYGYFEQYGLFGSSQNKETPSDVHLTANDGKFLATAFMRRYGFNELVSAPRVFLNVRSGDVRSITVTGSYTQDPNVIPTWRLTAASLDATLDIDRTLFVRMNMNGTPSEVMRFMGGGGGIGLQMRHLTGLSGFAASGSFIGDQTSVTAISSGGQFTMRWLRSTTIREHLTLGYNITLTGTGTPLKAFDIAAGDTAYSTASDYTSNEMRFGYDSVTRQLRVNMAPFGLGAMREVILPAIDGSKGRGSTVVAFDPTDDNFDTASSFVANQVRFAVDPSTHVLTAKHYDGTTLRTLTLGTFT
ncbi:MAG: hypothetical protein JWP92_3748 [Caulobacter sp.]|nr:hypothetical protein [Caulobacter sp.]